VELKSCECLLLRHGLEVRQLRWYALDDDLMLMLMIWIREEVEMEDFCRVGEDRKVVDGFGEGFHSCGSDGVCSEYLTGVALRSCNLSLDSSSED